MTPEIEARRERVREMHAQGMRAPEIAEALGVSIGTVYRDRFKLGLPRHIRPAAERVAVICPDCGKQRIYLRSVAKHIKSHLCSSCEKKRRPEGMQGAVAGRKKAALRRRVEIARLMDGGLVPKQIMHEMGLCSNTVYHHIAAIREIRAGRGVQ